MLNSAYLKEISNWVSSTLAQVNEQLVSIKSSDDAKLAKRRINLFINEIEQKKREINLHIKEVRQQFDQQEPSQGLSSRRTRKDIDAERNKLIQPWEGSQVVLDNLITKMKQTLFEIDKQIMEQTNSDE